MIKENGMLLFSNKMSTIILKMMVHSQAIPLVDAKHNHAQPLRHVQQTPTSQIHAFYTEGWSGPSGESEGWRG